MILKKLNNSHYVILSDEKTLSNNRDWYLGHPDYNTLHQWNMPKNSKHKNKQIWINKVLYSTQPLEEIHGYGEKSIDVPLYTIKGFNTIKQLSLSEVEEAIYGYSVEKMAKENITGKDLHSVDMRIGFERGFKAHQELVEDKLFTIEDMENMFILGGKHKIQNPDKFLEKMKEIIQSLLPKTEWDIEFIDSKIKLI